MAYGLQSYSEHTDRSVTPRVAGLCGRCSTQRKGVFSVCGPGLCRVIARDKTSAIHHAGHVLYGQGSRAQGLYCVGSGVLALRRIDPNGEYRILKLVYPGDVLGYQALLEDSTHTHSAVVLETARVCFVPVQCVQEHLLNDPSFQKEMFQRLVAEINRAENARVQESTLPLKSRLCLFLKELSQRVPEHASSVLHMPLQRQELAALLGARPETLARTLAELTRANIAQFKGREVFVLDKDALFACAGNVE